MNLTDTPFPTPTVDTSVAYPFLLFFLFFVWMVAVQVSTWLDTFKISFIHESTVQILLGLVFGVSAFAAVPDSHPLLDLEFYGEAFFSFVLPPIVFAAAYTLDTRKFFNHSKAIMFLAVLGTIINFAILGFAATGAMTWGWVEQRHYLNAAECLLFAAMMASTDTVAVVSILDPVATPALYAILAGEGIINDAVSVVLFKSVENMLDDDGSDDAKITFIMLLKIFGEFLYIFLGSMGVGTLFGLLSSLVFNFNRERPSIVREVTPMFLTGFATYMFAEMFNLSGIVSVFILGLTMKHFCAPNLSFKGRVTFYHLLDSLSYGLVCVVYVSLGFYIPHYANPDTWNANFSLNFFLWMLGTIMVARVVYVFGLIAMAQFGKLKRSRVTTKETAVVAYGGTIRGVVAFALAHLAPANDARPVLICAAWAMVMFTSVLGASFARPFFQLMGVGDSPPPQEDDKDKPLLDDFELSYSQPTVAAEAGHELSFSTSSPSPTPSILVVHDDGDVEGPPAVLSPGSINDDGDAVSERKRRLKEFRSPVRIARKTTYKIIEWDERYLQRFFGGKRQWEDDGGSHDDEDER